MTQEESESDEEENEEELAAQRMEDIEADFKFEELAQRLCHPKIIQCCGYLLKTFDSNSEVTNHSVLKLLHRVAWDCKMSALIFQASIFRTFQRIFEERQTPQFKELVKFATYIVRQFVKVSEKNPKVFMELLFWKNTRDAYDIEEGYGAYDQKSQANKHAWTEEEEDELRMLCLEYKRNDIEEDAIDWLQNNLVNNTRTRKGIMKKLRELYLLMDYTNKKKNSLSSRPTKDWSEQEIAQLTQLFEQFRDGIDPLGCIVERLTVCRPKKRVADKILELGLIQDKKELRKKRSKKSQQERNRSGPNEYRSGLGSELDTATSSSEDEDNQSTRQTNIQKTTSRKTTTNTKKKKNTKVVKASRAEIAKILLKLMEKGMKESLEWLHESLIEAADDIEEDGSDENEGIPLVAIFESATTAMEDELFQNVLIAIGVSKPADEQEIYWRIPTSSIRELRSNAEIIKEAIDGTLTIPEELDTQSQNSATGTQGNQEESSDEDVFDRLRLFTSKPEGDPPKSTKKKPSEANLVTVTTEKEPEDFISDILSKENKRRRVVIESNSEDDSDKENISTSNTNRLISESDESNDVPSQSFPTQNDNMSTQSSSRSVINKNKNKKRKIIHQSDSEDDMEDIRNDNSQTNSQDTNNGYHTDNSTVGNKNINSSRRFLNDSDSEDVPSTSFQNVSSNRNPLDDSDDDDQPTTTVQDENPKRNRESDSENERNKTKKKKIIISDDEDD